MDEFNFAEKITELWEQSEIQHSNEADEAFDDEEQHGNYSPPEISFCETEEIHYNGFKIFVKPCFEGINVRVSKTYTFNQMQDVDSFKEYIFFLMAKQPSISITYEEQAKSNDIHSCKIKSDSIYNVSISIWQNYPDSCDNISDQTDSETSQCRMLESLKSTGLILEGNKTDPKISTRLDIPVLLKHISFDKKTENLDHIRRTLEISSEKDRFDFFSNSVLYSSFGTQWCN
ncbi:unnamed protein product [Moneuplotes crassus]|uniref:Uncharacterized protein n=1 Tax=Euplotes crassus TaxID=5936 RepID=A0AAD1UT64_EUPCR|nr:unnamed protein product [Moneuplotes crassus]